MHSYAFIHCIAYTPFGTFDSQILLSSTRTAKCLAKQLKRTCKEKKDDKEELVKCL